MLLVTFFLGVLLIFSTYAWFQASLDVKVKMVNLVVSKKNGLFISLDGIDFGSSVEISEENLKSFIGKEYKVLIENVSFDGKYFMPDGFDIQETDIYLQFKYTSVSISSISDGQLFSGIIAYTFTDGDPDFDPGVWSITTSPILSI